MSKYSLDITSKNCPFINIEVENDEVLLGAYESGKVARKLFFINKDVWVDKKQLMELYNEIKKIKMEE